MNSDPYQQAWQAQSSRTRITIDAESLLKEVQRKDQKFRSTILWRDYREVGVAVVLLPVWIFMGIQMASPWTWYLTIPALIWVAGFMLVYRMRHMNSARPPDEPLVQCVRRSLAEVKDQIWLLRNIAWWYLLPFGFSLAAFLTQLTWSTSDDWLEALGKTAVLVGFLLAVYYFVYWVNQRAVRTCLEPRRQELLALLASLSDDPPGEKPVA